MAGKDQNGLREESEQVGEQELEEVDLEIEQRLIAYRLREMQEFKARMKHMAEREEGQEEGQEQPSETNPFQGLQTSQLDLKLAELQGKMSEESRVDEILRKIGKKQSPA